MNSVIIPVGDYSTSAQTPSIGPDNKFGPISLCIPFQVVDLLIKSPQEVLNKVILVNHIVVMLVFKVSHDMALLLPEVDQFLELHLALSIENVGDIQVVDKSLSLELLSDLRLDVGNGHIQLVQVTEFFGTSDVPAVQMEDSLSHVGLGERATSGLGEFRGESHVLMFLCERFPVCVVDN